MGKDDNKKRITPRHLMLSIKKDEELNKLIKATIAGGGVVPTMHQNQRAFRQRGEGGPIQAPLVGQKRQRDAMDVDQMEDGYVPQSSAQAAFLKGKKQVYDNMLDQELANFGTSTAGKSVEIDENNINTLFPGGNNPFMMNSANEQQNQMMNKKKLAAKAQYLVQDPQAALHMQAQQQAHMMLQQKAKMGDPSAQLALAQKMG